MTERRIGESIPGEQKDLKSLLGENFLKIAGFTDFPTSELVDFETGRHLITHVNTKVEPIQEPKRKGCRWYFGVLDGKSQVDCKTNGEINDWLDRIYEIANPSKEVRGIYLGSLIEHFSQPQA